jgi:hypothetical protein
MRIETINEINSKVNEILLNLGKYWELALAYEFSETDASAFDEWLPAEQAGKPTSEIIDEAKDAYWNIGSSLEELEEVFASAPLAIFDTYYTNVEYITQKENKRFNGASFRELADWILYCVDDAIKTIQDAPIIEVKESYENDTYDLIDGSYIHGTGDGRYYNKDGSRIYNAIIVNHELLGFYED